MYNFGVFALILFSTDFIGFKVKVEACDCVSDDDSNVSCVCDGVLGHSLKNLPVNLRFLTLKRFDFHILKTIDLDKTENVIDIQLDEFRQLSAIERDFFNRFPRLRSLSITKAPALSFLSLDIFRHRTHNLHSLEITKTGLSTLPVIYLKWFFNDINIEGNSIATIKSNNIMVEADQLILDSNKISSIERWAFNGSKISKISLRGNRMLTVISEEAFYGLSSLIVLDLSDTSITSIPYNGLEELEMLIVEQTRTLKIIPSIYDFTKLTTAKLTFSFHCCAFSLPQKHNPDKYASYQTLHQKIDELCRRNEIHTNISTISVPFSLNEDEEWHDSPVTPGSKDLSLQNTIAQDLLRMFIPEHLLQNTTLIALCGSFRNKKYKIVCEPLPNAFNPCEDIMGYRWLRICIWFVLLIGLIGNICVLAVTLCQRTTKTVRNFLILNLSFSDLCMAIFLLLLASEDLISRHYYFNYAYDWQRGAGCRVAGFITIFSSQLSIFVLCLLTIERWFAIKKALYLNKLTYSKIVVIIMFGWLYALSMASLPLVGISNYSTTSICLPMNTETVLDKAYIFTLLLFATVIFGIVCFCYYQIYFSLSEETRCKNGEYVLARKMTILAGTNFLCWAPIVFFSTTALLGVPLIDVTHSKILLVFFYPLNSCANPFLYAILTTNFKKNFVYLLSKFGFCKETARRYRQTFYKPKRGDIRTNQILRPLMAETEL